MSDCQLVRRYLPDGTTSKVTIGAHTLYGVERPRTDPDHPCIPQARYRLERHHGPKAANGPIWAMVNEDEGVFHTETMKPEQVAAAKAKGLRIRTDCLFGHVGNDPKDVEGCVAFGRSREEDKAWVSESHNAVIDFQGYMADWTPDVGVVISEESAP